MQANRIRPTIAAGGRVPSVPLEGPPAFATISGMTREARHGILGVRRVGPAMVAPGGPEFSTAAAPLWNRWISGWLRLPPCLKPSNVSVDGDQSGDA